MTKLTVQSAKTPVVSLADGRLFRRLVEAPAPNTCGRLFPGHMPCHLKPRHKGHCNHYEPECYAAGPEAQDIDANPKERIRCLRPKGHKGKHRTGELVQALIVRSW